MSSRKFHSLYLWILLSNCAHHGTRRLVLLFLWTATAKVSWTLSTFSLTHCYLHLYKTIQLVSPQYNIYTEYPIKASKRKPFSTFLIPTVPKFHLCRYSWRHLAKGVWWWDSMEWSEDWRLSSYITYPGHSGDLDLCSLRCIFPPHSNRKYK